MRAGLVIMLPLFWKGITCQFSYGFSINVPRSVSVQEGLCVTIPCKFTAAYRNKFSDSFGYWRLDPPNSNYIVATNDQSSDVRKTNFILTGNPDTGDCSLTITDAREEDAGIYFFRFKENEKNGVKYSFNNAKTTITVIDFTEEPVISDPGTVMAGINKTLTCTPPGNCSATSLVIQWRKSNVAGIWENSSTVTFTPSLYDLQENITCEMTNSNGMTTQKTILLDVCCPPAIIITWEINGKIINKPASIEVDEGSSVTLICSLQSNLPLNVTWMDGKNDVLQHGIGTELELRLENMTMNHTGTYTCSALTKHVINFTSINVTVQYPPRNMKITIKSTKGRERTANQQVIIDQTEILTFVCKVDGNPAVSVVWVKGEVDTEIPKTSNSELSAMINVTSSKPDVYRCLAWNALGLKEQRIHVVFKQDNPETTAAPRSGNKISYWNVAIGFICGIGLTILILLLYKLITRKKKNKKMINMTAEESSASTEPPTEDIYMNVSCPEEKAEEATDNMQLDSSGVTLDEDNLHYSAVAFTAKSSKVPSSYPETEYAEVKVK
ncbi:sialic acid-binding Ig-like lectin 13 [Eleutherodactylus coqui]|uniref:sialic acid-binding Ig-like lectin 13 n=1 Tax=Eleutherodactylus coqui TaxID=57060 RepID=UPI0034632E07